jgi:hypothetical protein
LNLQKVRADKVWKTIIAMCKRGSKSFVGLLRIDDLIEIYGNFGGLQINFCQLPPSVQSFDKHFKKGSRVCSYFGFLKLWELQKTDTQANETTSTGEHRKRKKFKCMRT